jgi:hypothetical protein
MAPAPLALLVIVIGGPGGRSGSSAHQRALLAIYQSAGSCASRGADADSLHGLTFSRLRVMTSPSLRCRTVERERQRQQANRQSQRDRAPRFLPIHKPGPPNSIGGFNLEVSGAYYLSDSEIHPKEASRRCQGSVPRRRTDDTTRSDIRPLFF